MPKSNGETSLLTVMFTDVVGSTEMRTRMGDAAAQAILDAHREVVRHAVETNGGRVVKSLGDGYLAAFESPRHALGAAVAIQREHDQPVAVRIGLNTGEVLEQDGDVLGEAVHAAARIASTAEGGQIIAADVVRHFAGTMPGLSFYDRGSLQLRGFPEAWRLVEVRWRVDEIEVRLFGPPEIRRAGAAVAVDTRKAIAVLAYLAAEGGPISRDTLVGLLWSESPQSKARAALRRTLSALRSPLAADVLHADGDALSLGGALVVDCMRFSALVRSREPADWADALSLYRGDFLEGFALRDAPEFEHWQRLTADRYRRAADQALDRLSADAGENGKPTAAVEFAARRVALDPLNEPAHRQLMSAYARAGDRPRALAQYDELTRLLSAELAVEPLPETKELHESIREGAPRRPPMVEVTRPEPGRSPLVGRDRELAALLERLDEGWFMAVVGEAGIGKTRLVDELAVHARRAGRRVLAARGYEGEEGLSFAPALSWLRQAGLNDEVLARLTAVNQLDGSDARLRVFSQLADALGISQHSGVLILDDAHLADDSTVNFLTYVAHRLQGHQWLVVATWRAEEVTGSDPLAVLLTRGGREGWANAIELARLDREAVELLVGPHAAERVLHDSEGLPLLVTAYAAGAEPETGKVLDAVESLVGARVAALSPIEHQVLEAVAVIGRGGELDLLRAVAGRTAEETAEALSTLERVALLTTVPDGRSAFTHHKIADVVLRHMSPARLNLLHERAAAVLRRHAGREAEAARHCEAIGLDAEAATLLFAAAKRSQRLAANDDAIGHLRAALALGHADMAAITEAIGDLETLEGRYDDARRAYVTAAALVSGGALAVLEHKWAQVDLRAGDWGAAASHLDSALRELDESTPPLRARIIAAQAAVAERTGDVRTAAARAETAIEAAALADDPGAQAAATNVAGLIARRRHELQEAARLLRDSLRCAELAEDPMAGAAALNNLGLVLVESGEPERGVDQFEASLQLLTRLGDRHRQAAVHSNLADALHALGRRNEAVEHLKRSAVILAELGGPATGGRSEIWSLTAW
jgi:DNA-binding SARP family transcriptional activator